MQKYKIVAVNPVTKKILKRPKTGQDVRYFLQGPRGGIYPVTGAPIQSYSKTDIQGINKTISGKRNFILYEELTNKILRDKHGNKIVKRDKKGNVIVHKTRAGKIVPEYYKAKKFTFYKFMRQITRVTTSFT